MMECKKCGELDATTDDAKAWLQRHVCRPFPTTPACDLCTVYDSDPVIFTSRGEKRVLCYTCWSAASLG